MKSSQFALAGLLCAATVFTACGDDVTKVTKIEENSGMEIVASADSLGKCTAEISGEMKFVSKENAVFVCADSAWQNVLETKETTCSAEALSDSSGFKIVCDGDSIGVVKNGANGENGKDGKKGDAGEGCEITDNGDGTVSVVCGEGSTTLYKAFCDGMLYNPDSSFCLDDVVIANSVLLEKKKAVWNLMNPEIEYEMFADKRDNQVYRSVKIGKQVWMAENLNYAYQPDTASFCYENNPEKCQKYGRLYTWEAALAVCPEGWHLSDTTEWNLLESYVAEKKADSSAVCTALKMAFGWEESGNSRNNFGFSALPGGEYSDSQYFAYGGVAASFWTSVATSGLVANARELFSVYFNSVFLNKSNAISVRCIKDSL